MSQTSSFPEVFIALAAPFGNGEVRQRSQGGRQLDYITARTAMNRLDDVLGPENWWDEYVPGENSVLCKLTIRLPDGSTLTKQDAGGNAGMSDQGDDEKSGYSDAFKRACVKLGVGRHLYGDGIPAFVAEAIGGQPRRQTAPPPQRSYQNDDARPTQRTYGATPQGAPQQRPPQQNGGGNRDFGDRPPGTGRALFAWAKTQQERGADGLIDYLNKWMKLDGGFPARMVDCDADQTARAYQEAVRRLSGAPDEPQPSRSGARQFDEFDGQGHDQDIPF